MAGIESPGKYVCVGCGRDTTERQSFDVGALSPILRGCAPCIDKHGGNRIGVERLRNEADRLLSIFENKRAAETVPAHLKGRCFHCGELVMRDLSSGLYPMLCQACIREWQNVSERGRAGGIEA